MIDLFVIEGLMFTSFFFTLWNMFFNYVPKSSLMILFVASCIINSIATLYGVKNSIYKLLPLTLIIAGLLVPSGLIPSIFISLFSVFYLFNIVNRTKNLHYSRGILSSYWVLGVYIVMKEFESPNASSSEIIPVYFIMYMLLSLLFMRTKRHISAGLDRKKIRQHNLVYLGGMTLGYFFLSNEDLLIFLKDKFFSLLNLLLKPLNAFGAWLGKKGGDMFRTIEKGTNTITTTIESTQGAKTPPTQVVPQDSAIGDVFKYIIIFFVCALALFALSVVIFKVLTRSKEVKNYSNDLSEERELLDLDEEAPKRRFFGLLSEKYPDNPLDQIRYWYRKYLRRLDKKNAYISNFTTLEILDSSKKLSTDEETLKSIRNDYVKFRYTSNTPTSKDVEDIKDKVKKLKL